jgi:hypothetical protein
MISAIDSFLLAGNDEVDTALGTSTMTCAGQSFAVVIDDVSKSASGEEMGLTGDYALTATAQPGDVSGPDELVNKRCTVGGATYRVSRVRIGSVAITFELQDPAQS